MQRLLAFHKQTCVFNRQGQLVGQDLQDRDVFLCKGRSLVGLHVQHTDHPVLHFERQCDLRARQRQHRVAEEYGILAYIQGNPRLARGSHISDNSLLADHQAVTLGEHPLAALRRCRPQDCVPGLFSGAGAALIL